MKFHHGIFLKTIKNLEKKKKHPKPNVVKVYPDVVRKAMHVVARQGIQKEIDFLVFDINGNMVLNYKMKAGDRKRSMN